MTDQANKSNLNLVSYDNMTFGEMISSGWSYKGNTYWAGTDDNGKPLHLTNLSNDALKFYEPLINDFLISYLYMYYPSQDNLDVWRILLNNAITTAVLDNAPVLNLLFYPSIQPDGKVGQNGVMNIEEGGTEGRRAVDFGTQFPQAMLDGNIGDYGSDGNAKSDKIVKYKPSLQSLKDFYDLANQYKDAIHRIAQEVETSGVFSAFIY